MPALIIQAKEAVKDIFKDSLKASIEMYKIMIPVIIAIKILQELELIKYLAAPLEPLMKLVGLPAEMGLVWATALLNNIYTSVIVFASLVKDTPMSAAQATVLAVMILMAHGLPVESSISRKAGARFLFQSLFRVVCALILGWILHMTYDNFDLLQGPASIIFQPDSQSAAKETLLAWSLGKAKDLSLVFLIIFGLMGLLKILTKIGVTELLDRLLRPLLGLMGIGPKASAITVIGLSLGLAYGGGLIISEAMSGNVDKKDVFYSISLMGIAHSLIEDTLLMVMIGGHFSGILWARLAFSLLAVAMLVRVTKRLSERFCDKYLWCEPGSKQRSTA